MTLQSTTVKIDADAILAEFETLSKPNGNVKVLAHSEILNAILETLDAIDFKEAANLEAEEKLPQKHLLSFASMNCWER